MARPIPSEESRFPLTAVAGEFISFSPKMKRIAAPTYASPCRNSKCSPDIVFALNL
jgi:hypothetical protein